MNNFLTFHAEATPDGVNIMHRSNDGRQNALRPFHILMP